MTDFPRAPLGEVLDGFPSGRLIQQGWSPQCYAKTRNNEGEWAVLTTTAIQEGRYQPNEHKLLPSALAPRPELEVRPGDLLLTSAGPRRRCAIPCLVRATPGRLLLSGKMYRFRTLPSRMLPEFLESYLLSPEAQRALEQMKTGISDSGLNLTQERLLGMSVPCPGLDEQRRIVDTLEDHLSRLDAAARLVGNSDVRLVQLHRTSVAATVKQAQTATGTAASALGKIANIGTGSTPLKARSDYYAGGDIPWTTSGDLAQGVVREPSGHVTREALEETSLKLWPVGTLLVAMYGEGKTRGRVAELGIESTTNQACAAISLHDPDESLRAWVRLVLESKYDTMRGLASGGVQPNLNLRLIRAIEIPVPEPATRAALLAHHEERVAAGQALRTELGRVTRRNARLRKALLVAAFAGTLGTDEVTARTREGAHFG